jgi:hypothetical protein
MRWHRKSSGVDGVKFHIRIRGGVGSSQIERSTQGDRKMCYVLK